MLELYPKNIKDKDETIMTIGDTKYTKGDEYELLKISTGSDLTMELVKQAIYKQEVKVTKKMKEKEKGLVLYVYVKKNKIFPMNLVNGR